MAPFTTTDTAQMLLQTQEVLAHIQSRQTSNPLSIDRLSEPLTASATPSSLEPQTESFPTNSSDGITPSTLTADLSHYRDLFTKLHFSYIEQVTKEKYLRAIVGDPPLLHTHQENVELETEVLEMKRQLKEKKIYVEEIVESLKSESESLARNSEEVKQKMSRVTALESALQSSSDRLNTLRFEIEQKESQLMSSPSHTNNGPNQRLGLEDTLSLIAQQEASLQLMEEQIQSLQQDLPDKTRECETAEQELEILEQRKNDATKEAGEARRRREKGDGKGDEVEERGRWYRSQEAVYRGVGLVEG